MGSSSQEILRSFCSNTDWNYAVFWKFNHQSPMVLTLEDVYYDNHAPANSPEVHGCGVIPKNIHEGHQAHDLLGLAIAKMSYHMYSVGEGIIGQVAVSGKHQWIFPEYCDSYHSAFEFHNVWESQISAGIKTVLVVAVGPFGVVQLGSYRKVDEDTALVNHIRHLFFRLKDPLADHAATLMQCNKEAFPDCSRDVDKAMEVKETNIQTRYKTRRSDNIPYNTSSSCLRIENIAQLTGVCEAVQGCGSYSGVTFGLVDAKHEKPVGTNIISGCKDPIRLDPNLRLYSENHGLNNTSSSASALGIEAESLITGQSYPSMISSGYTIAGSELLEAFGSAFKQTSDSHELVNSEDGSTIIPTGDMSHSQFTFNSGLEQDGPWTDQGLTNYQAGPGPENLLDAVVANVCHTYGNARDDTLPSRLVESLLTSMEIAESSGQKNQLPSAEVDARQNPSDICGAFSSIGFSSTCPSSSSDQFKMSLEMPKKIKKRAKPGESTRPRPRDRQLIQDRIKELRELVPNGSKCSIDSLLERTIKHMLFLQNVTKHAEKLSKSGYTKSQMQQKETGTTQGSSCAVEVGGHLQVYSIIVENLNKQGMLLIEMLCEECSHFLEIASMIKSLDLTILRGVTETQGDKSWICFVVESQSNKVMQRLEILWSLVQIFQPKGS